MRALAVLGVGSAALLVLYACVGDDPVANNQPDAAAGTDASNTPTNTTDGATTQNPTDSGNPADAGACNPTADFGTPVALTPLNTSFQEKSITLTEDEKTVYFLSENKVFSSTRASVNDVFAAPTEVTSLNASHAWQSVFVTHDAEYIYLATATQVFWSLFKSGAFATPANVEAPGSSGVVGTIYGEYMYTNEDKADVFYDQRQEAADAGGLFHARILDPGNWDTPQLIGPQFHGVGDHAPVLTHDQLTLYFAGQRAAASVEIMKTTRPSLTEAWSDPTVVSSVSSDGDDEPNWLSADGCRLYLTSTAHGNDDLYVATRPK